MPLRLSEAEPADFDAIMRIQFAAFAADHEPYHDVLFPGGNTAAARAAARDRTLAFLRADPSATFLKVTDGDAIVAAAKWCVYPDDPFAAGPGDPFACDWWGGPGHEEMRAFADHVINAIHLRRVRSCSGHPHLFLDILYTDPAHQRRGAGTLAVQWGTAKADAMGVKAYVESTRYARHLYEQNGFRVTEHVVVPVPDKWKGMETIQYDFMEREVGGGKQ